MNTIVTSKVDNLRIRATDIIIGLYSVQSTTMLHNQKKQYLCSIGSIGSAADVTCNRVVILGRELKDSRPLFFIASQANHWNDLLLKYILSIINLLILVSYVKIFHVIYEENNVNYSTTETSSYQLVTFTRSPLHQFYHHMKRIKITKDENLLPVMHGPHIGLFQITLYWNQTYYFSSKKKALRFVAITNQFLTQSMYKANSLYIDVWVKYRRDWGYFENETSGFELASKNRLCESALNACAESFNLMVERSNYESGSFIVHNKINVIISSLNQAIAILKDINSKLGGTADLYLIDDFTERIYSLENSLKNFGDYEAKHLTKRPIHETIIQPSMLIANAQLSATG